MISLEKQLCLLAEFCGTLSRTADSKTSRASLEQFQTTTTRGNPYTHWSRSTHALEHTTGQQELRQRLQQGVGN